VDVFSSAFFMLTRYEEVVKPDRDNHDRFPATASLAFQEGFLDRPIIDEYVEVLWAVMKKLWPGLEWKRHEGRIFVTCDVDNPFDSTVANLRNLVRVCAGDLLKRRSVPEVCRRIRRFAYNRVGDYQFDPNYTFDWYLDICERSGHKVAFYFLPSSKEPGNGSYSLNHKGILRLLKQIHDRGHEIGVHGTYQTYQDADKVGVQKTILEKALCRTGINQDIKGNRQHYLRWDSAKTPDVLEKAGFAYDATGSFADMPGFRYGTAKEFPMWSWEKRNRLRLKQRPLIVMECSVLDAPYMNLGHGQKALNLIHQLRTRSLLYGGTFTLLWHNSHLKTDLDRELFLEAISLA
jgi:hypothetical protein